jgi:SnoaL-like protein
MSTADQFRVLLQRYAHAADARDIDTLLTLFHPDAEITGAGGTQSLDAWLASMREPRRFPGSMHMIGEPLVQYQEGSDAATMDSYAVVYLFGTEDSGDGHRTMGVKYHDEMILHRFKWMFWRRTMTTLWTR